VFSDYFSDEAVSRERWKLGSLTAGAPFTDEGVEVSEADGTLQIKPRSGFAGRSYNGYVSASARDMTAAHARVEVLQTTVGTANTIFAVGIDSDNWYGFVVESGKLYMQSKISGRKNSTNIPYSPSQHRFWRLRHEATDNQILWETSPDGQKWTERRRLAPQISLTEVFVYLGAGTYLSESNPGTAVFDNFKFVVHTEQ
jgi:hypothetical protein